MGATSGADAIGKVSLAQCSKVAQGACMQAAGEVAPDACQTAAAKGFKNCSGAQFAKHFHDASAVICTRFAKTVTEVDPTTGQWVQPSGRRLAL